MYGFNTQRSLNKEPIHTNKDVIYMSNMAFISLGEYETKISG